MQQCSLQFGRGSDFNRNLNHIYHQEFDILNAQINEIDRMIQRIRDEENKLNSFEKEGTNKSKCIDDSEPIVNPMPRISYNLHSGSHYWDIIHGNPRGV